MSGYVSCACWSCFEIAIGEAGEAMCWECEEAECEACNPEAECSAPHSNGCESNGIEVS